MRITKQELAVGCVQKSTLMPTGCLITIEALPISFNNYKPGRFGFAWAWARIFASLRRLGRAKCFAGLSRAPEPSSSLLGTAENTQQPFPTSLFVQAYGVSSSEISEAMHELVVDQLVAPSVILARNLILGVYHTALENLGNTPQRHKLKSVAECFCAVLNVTVRVHIGRWPLPTVREVVSSKSCYISTILHLYWNLCTRSNARNAEWKETYFGIPNALLIAACPYKRRICFMFSLLQLHKLCLLICLWGFWVGILHTSTAINQSKEKSCFCSTRKWWRFRTLTIQDWGTPRNTLTVPIQLRIWWRCTERMGWYITSVFFNNHVWTNLP